MSEYRPRLSTEEYELVKNFREQHKALAEECDKVGIDVNDVPHYWYKGEHFSIFGKREKESGNKMKAMMEQMIKEVKEHAPVYPIIKRPEVKDAHLAVIDVADPHFGKYASKDETGESYSIAKAESRFFAGIEGLCAKIEKEKLDRIVYIGGNDRLHTDNPFRTTTSGTKQDTDGMWHEAYLSAKRCDVKALEMLLTIADVHFVHCPSNHDFQSGFFLAESIQSHFHNNQNITFDVTPSHRKYFQYGNSLIGTTHGDGAKEIDLSDLMKTECKKGWSLSKYAYWYVHHIHHKDRKAKKGTETIKLEKDAKGLTVLYAGKGIEPEDYAYVEYIRSMSAPDRWHYTNAFCHSPKAVEAFLHHKEYGQVNRFSHLF